VITSYTQVKLTLPLGEESVLHDNKPLPKHLKLPLCRGLGEDRLGEDIYNFLVHKNVLKSYYSLLNPVFDEVVHDLNMFGPIMKHYILKDFDATLIVTVNHNNV
jgi:hypothetical protein